MLVVHDNEGGKGPLASDGVLEDGHVGVTKVKLEDHSSSLACLAFDRQASISSTAPNIMKLAEKTVKFESSSHCSC